MSWRVVLVVVLFALIISLILVKYEYEMLYKLRRGFGISMRLASGSEDLHNLIKLLKINKNIDTRKVTLNADVISASDLRDKGYLDRAIKIVIKAGIPTIEAYQMATINTAENLKISSYYGSIAVSYKNLTLKKNREV